MALVPLLVAVVRVSALRAAGLGALWGVVVGFASGWVLPSMLGGYFGLPALLAWGGAVVLYLLLAGVQVAAFAAWFSWMARRRPLGPLAIAAAWGATELLRGHSPVRCPWVLLAYSQESFQRLIQLADLAGPYGIGMLVAAGNAAVAGFILPALRTPRPALGRLGVLAAVLTSLVYGQWRLSTPFGSGDPQPVLVVQGDVERGFQWKPEYTDLGIDRYVNLTREQAAAGPRLVVWPEYAVSFYLQEIRPQSRRVLDTIRPLGADLVLGGPHYEFANGRTIYHNSVFVVREGRVTGRYDKLRLIPFAEEDVDGLIHAHTGFTAGSGIRLLDTQVGRLGPLVCWEAMYPELSRELAAAGADVLINLSNDSWFARAPQAHHHLAMAALRAIENRRWVIRATQTGISAVIDPYGRIVRETAFDTPATLHATVRASNVLTPYERWGDAVAWAAVAATLLFTIARARREVTPPDRSPGKTRDEIGRA